MADPVLSNGQYSIGKEGSASAFIYGGRQGSFGNSILIDGTTTDTGAINVQDQSVVGHDGLLFGVDTMPGMVVTQTGKAYTSPSQGASAMDAYSAFAGAWNDPTVRLADNAVQVLRAKYPGSTVTRRAYGRGRKIMPSMGLVYQGQVPFTAQFQCADNTWYSDVLYSVSVTINAVRWRPFQVPIGQPPISVQPGLVNQNGVISNAGALPTWPVFTITGPVANPLVTYINTPVSIGYTGVLGTAETLVIDTRPWARTALKNGFNVAGFLAGSAMIAMQAQPGNTQFAYSGSFQIFSNTTSTCTVSWRNATLSIGGTV